MRRLLHISDLHFGKTDVSVIDALLLEAKTLEPNLVIVSGDLTQRARRGQFAEAAEFLARLPCPFLAVPGNHDIPLYHLSLRFFQPLRAYKRYIESQTEPAYEDSEIMVAGLNTATRWRWVEGRLGSGQIRRVKKLLRNTPPSAIKVLVMHHPPDEQMRDVERVLGECPDLVLSGHLHKNAAERHSSGVVFVSAGTATSTRLRGERNTFNVIDLVPPSPEGAGRIEISVHAWGGSKFEYSSKQEFTVLRRD